MRVAAIAVVALALGGCLGSDLEPGSVVSRARIVGARVSPDRDRDAAWAEPGDAVTIEWMVVAPPEDRAPIAATLGACRPVGSSCAPGTLSPLPARPPSTEPFVTTLVLPNAATVGASPSWLLLGAVCFGGASMGELADPPTDTRCRGADGEHAASIVALDIPFGLPGTPANRHPTLDEAWTLDGQPWDEPPAEVPADACAERAGGADLPAIAAEPTRELSVSIAWSEGDRERYETFGGDPPARIDAREELQLSHFATAGRLARTRTVVDDDDAGPAEIDWETPAVDDVPEGGLLVWFTVVARDDRAGVARADRALCVVR